MFPDRIRPRDRDITKNLYRFGLFGPAGELIDGEGEFSTDDEYMAFINNNYPGARFHYLAKQPGFNIKAIH